MYLSVLVCALLSVLVSSTPYAVKQEVAINSTEGVSVLIFQTNLKNTATLSVESAVDLVFCFQEQYSLTGLNSTSPVINRNPIYWGRRGVCSFVVKSTATQNVEVNLRMTPYAVAVYFQNATLFNYTKVNITLGVAGDSCADNTIFNGKECEAVIPVADLTKIEAPAGKVSAFKFNLDSTKITGRISIACQNKDAGVSFKLQRDNTPLVAGSLVGTCDGEAVVIDNPRNGLNGYYLLVDNTKNVTETISITATVCLPGFGGFDCKTEVRNATTVPVLVTLYEDYYYFKVNVSADGPVWASVRRTNGTQLFTVNPFIFASRNQLPTRGNADVGGCTGYYCDLVHTIYFNATAEETWYIGIQNSDKVLNGTSVGVWFNSICAPDCGDHGTCAKAGPQIGFCDCIDGFIGVDCALANGFGPQFIVLIIIAVLVALTAVIGFGAWAYMKRKRGQYDIVA